MTISEAMAYIQGYQKSGKPVHDLSRIQALLDAIGNPQEQLQVIHIAGTNGKGSVTAFCAAAATAAGFRTGTLTSPFIQHYTDRIQIDGQDIPGEALCRFCEQVKAAPFRRIAHSLRSLSPLRCSGFWNSTVIWWFWKPASAACWMPRMW